MAKARSNTDAPKKIPRRLFWLAILCPPAALFVTGDVCLAIGFTLLLIGTLGTAWIVVAPLTVWHIRSMLGAADATAAAPTAAPEQQPQAEVPPLSMGGGANRPTKRCPACAEDILLDAPSCRFCGRKFSAEEGAQAVQDYQAQLRATALAAQQAEPAKQQQHYLKRLKGRWTRRLVFGFLLTWWGALIVISMIVVFFSSPAPGNTELQQKSGAVLVGFLFGFVPLASGIALLLAAKSAKRSLFAEQNRLMAKAIPPPIAGE